LLPRSAGVLFATIALILPAVSPVGCDDGTRTYSVRGTVHDVQPERGQALIEHEDIPGLMPAMTMSFDVPDPDVVARMRSGQVIEFELVFDGRSYSISDFEVVDMAPEDEGWVRFGDALLRSDPAPDFDLTDQQGHRVRLADYAGQVLLVDFIFTSCPGPCPILTASHVKTWRALPEAVRDRVHFVSISVDPARDTPEELYDYAEARGIDQSHWSFLTGTKDEIEPVLEAFGVGRTGGEGDPIEHTVITYLVDGRGRIVKRYFGLLHEPQALASDVATLVESQAPEAEAGRDADS
jgi:protein SCO1/2